MARGVKLKWAGAEQLKRTYKAVAQVFDDTDPRLKAVILVPARAMTADASNLAPMGKTGNLKKSLYATVGGAKQRGVLMGVKTKKAPYARFVEFGTVKMPAQPFFRPAVLKMFGSYVNDIAPGIKKLVEDTAAQNAYHPAD